MSYILKKGFTLLEILLVMSIIVIISFIVFSAFKNLKETKLLDEETNKVVSVFHRAYTDTLSGVGGISYGVHIEADKLTIFDGGTYTSGEATNRVTNLDPSVSISSINLTTGATNVVFSRLTGVASAEGTLIVSSIKDPNILKTVTVQILGGVSRD